MGPNRGGIHQALSPNIATLNLAQDLKIQPVILLPGWYVKSKGNYPVKAMNATYLIDYVKGVKRLFTPEQLAAVKRRLEEKCRVLEF